MRSGEDNREGIAAELDHLISSNRRPTVSSESESTTSIFRIPNILLKHNKKAYLPNAFSFGPWHHGNCNLQTTKVLKINYLVDLLPSSPDGRRTKLLELVSAVHQLKDRARQCYAEQISFSDDELVKILLLDGCFIVKFFLKYHSNATTRVQNDPIFNVACMLQSLYLDLILLENQIPWFVLQDIFDLTKEEGESNLELHQLAIHFFSKISPTDGLSETNEFSPKDILHVLDLLHKCLLAASSSRGGQQPSGGNTDESRAETKYSSAGLLSVAGVKFKPRKSKCILDIKFKLGVVRIPSLSINYATETVFRNLIAFEQCCYGLRIPTIFTSYAKFMNNLIRNVDDFQVLCRNGIISNSLLSPEEAAQFFNKICNDAPVTCFHYDAISKKVESHYKWRLIMLRTCMCSYCILLVLCRCCRGITCYSTGAMLS